MEVRIRNVDIVAVKKIDKMAKEKNMSRNEFLKRQIHDMAIMPKLKIEKDRLATTNEKLIEALQIQQKQLGVINDTLKSLTNLIIIATDMPDDKVRLILNVGDKFGY